MDSRMGKMTRKLSLAMVVVAALVLAMGMPGQASAATCAESAGPTSAGTVRSARRSRALPVQPHGPGGSDDHRHRQHHLQRPCARRITISVGGDMEMQAGSAIRAEDTVAGGSGGNITLTVGGNFTMRGQRRIRRRDFQQQDRWRGRHRRRRRHSDHGRQCHGQPGRSDHHVRHDTRWRHPRGKWRADPRQCGWARRAPSRCLRARTPRSTVWCPRRALGTTKGRGGPITIDACCDLVIGDTGKVISQGRDPGADLVHLQACIVEIFGLVASTGPGHEAVRGNLCNVNRPGKPANSGACVEIWAGTTLLIDSTGVHNGEVNADTAQAGGTRAGAGSISWRTAPSPSGALRRRCRRRATVTPIPPLPCTPTSSCGTGTAGTSRSSRRAAR